MKVSILQDSFVREIWNQVGKHAYLEMIHPLVLSNLNAAAHKSSAAAASVLLICSSEELGVPITIHQVRLIQELLVLLDSILRFYIKFPNIYLSHTQTCNLLLGYKILTIKIEPRQSCLLFTALGKDSLQMELMC